MSIFSRKFRVGSAPLARWSGGRPGRAALLLVGIHLAAGLVCYLPWLIGFAPLFDDARLVIVIAAGVLSCAVAMTMLLWLGFWGVGINSGQDGGEEYTQTFTPGKGFALGWLRWLMQIVMIWLAAVAFFFALVDARPWGLPGAEEVRSLSTRADRVPAPASWTLTSAGADNNDGVTTGREGAYELEYDVPVPLSEDGIRAWLTGPGWGPAFGRLQVLSCEPTLPSCTALAVPPDGGPSEFRVHVVARADTYNGAGHVKVRLAYERFHGYPDLDVSAQTQERLRRIPAPADWVRNEQGVSGEKNDNGESASMDYAVPEGLRRSDIKAWLLSDVWTKPQQGKAFGAIDVEGCSLDSGETTWWCEAHTDGTYPYVQGTPVELIKVGYDEAGGGVLVVLTRNG